MIGTYPDLTEIELTDRPVLDPLLRTLRDGLSELTFAGLYCFRAAHNYRIGRMADGTIVLAGADKGQCFFVCPFALPAPKWLDELFQRCTCMKLVTAAQAEPLRQAGYAVTEDRDNFDYLYHREQLTTLAGRALQRKRNLVHAFERAHDDYRSLPLSPELVPDALAVLEGWREHARDQADYAPSRDALLHMAEFGLQGRISYVGGQAAAYALGEPIGAPGMFVVHYEKTFPDIKGLYQVINRDFVRAMPPEITVVNREQDLDDPGLRQAKMTYRPFDFVKKYRVRKPSP
jgi:hypothetical protein